MDLQIGMLWFDDARDRPLVDKIAQAAAHYRAKYGRPPSICYIAARLAAELPALSDGLRIKGAPNILPNHFWLGIGQAQE